MQGPLLADCEFSEVLVAKTYSHDSTSVDLVLYNGKQAGTFTLGFERLTPGGKYSLSTGKNIVADKSGKASVDVKIDGRTELLLHPHRLL
jgi:hypothetical protein